MPNPTYYYKICCEHKGKVVRLYETSGREHVGRIVEVDEQYVWIERTVTETRGYSYGFYGPRFYPRPYVFPVALAALGGFALGAALFWW